VASARGNSGNGIVSFLFHLAKKSNWQIWKSVIGASIDS
jgi:hypothetical protein